MNLHTPFDNFNFGNKTCYLSGQAADEKVEVFPLWLQNRFQLQDKPFRQLNEKYTTYGKLKVPVNTGLQKEVINPFETKVENAFTSGYEAVKELSEQELFWWFGKLMYGIIFNEIQVALLEKPANEPLSFSATLISKFSNHLRFLQSLFVPTEFEEFVPYSVSVFKVKQGDDRFDYRNEMNTLVASLQMNGFGIVVCMQDNGENKRLHRPALELVHGKELHPIQFQEMNARFYYSAYLFNRIPQYVMLPPADASQKYTISAMPLHGGEGKSLFDQWNNKTYCQVLEAFWKPWGFVLYEIYKNPEQPMSFLVDEHGDFNGKVDQPF
ncbi:hypothetical protein C3K47_00625 [Solitalea longa]|uniref:Uncharacterized protein n=1 Tax=Solitalea longa TaxID=2079460 RepID=A0A2S5A8X8_9SPHI|nr:hypothetical protein [Solitalea longa]POY39038.1 hypothetical protein C3K47_00625 [Solitalea longa]